jgi:shikimate dehydrogenase
MLNDINGYTRTCGLIGNPVEHTLSPVIHNTLSMVLGKNLAYVRSMWRPEDWRMP